MELRYSGACVDIFMHVLFLNKKEGGFLQGDQMAE